MLTDLLGRIRVFRDAEKAMWRISRSILSERGITEADLERVHQEMSSEIRTREEQASQNSPDESTG
jgi:hypothetical protein